MRYYPGDPSEYRGRSVYHENLDDYPKEGSRFTKKIFSTKGGEEKLVREEIYECRYGTTKSGMKRKRPDYILVETIIH